MKKRKARKKYDVSLYRNEIDAMAQKKRGFPTTNDTQRVAFCLAHAKQFLTQS